MVKGEMPLEPRANQEKEGENVHHSLKCVYAGDIAVGSQCRMPLLSAGGFISA